MKIYVEVLIQTLLSFFSILFIARLLGRQQVSQLTFFEYVNGITFGSIAANLATDVNQRTMQHLIGLVLFGVLTGIMAYISIKKRSFRKIVEGEPILIIDHGKILENNLKRAKYSVDELMILLRQKDCFSPDEVDYALIEVNGNLSVIKRGDKRNVTLGDISLVSKNETIPTEVIIGGQIIYENLKKRKLGGRDLINNLKMFGVSRIDEVMFATVDQDGKFYVDKYDDKIPRKSVDISENNEGV